MSNVRPSASAAVHGMSPAWILVAGLALLCAGMAAEGVAGMAPAQDPTDPPQTSAMPAFATSDSNGSMIAVTGLDVTGSSILYLVDTENRALSVYQATGGTPSMMTLSWVGARNIDLDLRVDGFNDHSLHSYKQLAEMFGEEDGGSSTSLPGED